MKLVNLQNDKRNYEKVELDSISDLHGAQNKWLSHWP